MGTFVGIRIHRIEKLFLDQPLVFRYESLSLRQNILINKYLTGLCAVIRGFLGLCLIQTFPGRFASRRSVSTSCWYIYWCQHLLNRRTRYQQLFVLAFVGVATVRQDGCAGTRRVPVVSRSKHFANKVTRVRVEVAPFVRVDEPG